MGVTVYSVIVSVVIYNLSLIAVFLLRRSGAIRAKYTSALLLFLTLLGAIRLFTPIDLDDAFVIRSYKVLPAIEDALTAPWPGGLSLGKLILLIWAAGTLVFILRDLRRQWRFAAADRLLPLTDLPHRRGVREWLHAEDFPGDRSSVCDRLLQVRDLRAGYCFE